MAYVAWFVCRARGVTDDVALPLRNVGDEAEIIRQGRMRAARKFKREHEMHPCTRVDVEFQGVLTEDAYYAADAA